MQPLRDLADCQRRLPPQPNREGKLVRVALGARRRMALLDRLQSYKAEWLQGRSLEFEGTLTPARTPALSRRRERETGTVPGVAVASLPGPLSM